MTLGTRSTAKTLSKADMVDQLRRSAQNAVAQHHHRISQLSSSGLSFGDSMIRNFYIFDETHWAIEQQVSICMQAQRSGKGFTCKTPSISHSQLTLSKCWYGLTAAKLSTSMIMAPGSHGTLMVIPFRSLGTSTWWP